MRSRTDLYPWPTAAANLFSLPEANAAIAGALDRIDDLFPTEERAIAEKLAYIHRHWGMQTILHNGWVKIDSNSVENLIRPIALNRKNALFA
ncbi:hypothetical protein GGR30_004387 [Martelella radicis]|uniref:Transposase IS66 central domain-containing protein n=2 Tax=Martelella radicis TaxID=1397476 RepID=A0A7W6KQU7_9HYPH|nr:hypothetical protein [Martelella radicis]